MASGFVPALAAGAHIVSVLGGVGRCCCCKPGGTVVKRHGMVVPSTANMDANT